MLRARRDQRGAAPSKRTLGEFGEASDLARGRARRRARGAAAVRVFGRRAARGLVERQQGRAGERRQHRAGEPCGGHGHRSSIFAPRRRRSWPKCRRRRASSGRRRTSPSRRTRGWRSCPRTRSSIPPTRRSSAPDNRVSVIDLKANPPAVIATLEAGLSPAGIAHQPRRQSRARREPRRGHGVGLTIRENRDRRRQGRFRQPEARARPSVAFTPDGKTALVTRDGDHKISILSVDGTKVEDTKRTLTGGFRPYAIEVSPKGDIAVVVNQGGGAGDIDTINVIDLKGKAPRIVHTIDVGQIVEGVAFSNDGGYVAVTAQDGSNRPPNHPFHSEAASRWCSGRRHDADQGRRLRVANGAKGSPGAATARPSWRRAWPSSCSRCSPSTARPSRPPARSRSRRAGRHPHRGAVARRRRGASWRPPDTAHAAGAITPLPVVCASNRR